MRRKAPPETSPTLPRKLRPQRRGQLRRCLRPPVLKKHRERHRFWNLPLNNLRKSAGRPFESGQSGNPNGRPKGARNRVTQAVEALIDGQGEALGAKAVEKALEGDSTMLRALLSTLVPPRRERTVEFELPKIESAADARKASSAVIAACAAGELSPHEATEIMGLISTHVRTIEVAEIEARVTAVGKEAAAMSLRQLRARLDRLEARFPADEESIARARYDVLHRKYTRNEPLTEAEKSEHNELRSSVIPHLPPATTDEERAARARWNDLRRRARGKAKDQNHLRRRKKRSSMNYHFDTTLWARSLKLCASGRKKTALKRKNAPDYDSWNGRRRRPLLRG